MRYIAIIPAYNPGPVMIDVVNKALLYVDHIFLINDGCSEDHSEFFSVFSDHDRVEVVSHKNNLGKGHALYSGFMSSLDLDFDYIITIDSDGQHLPEEINNFKEYIEKSSKSFDFIIGERKVGRNMPLKSNIGNNVTGLLFRLFWGGNVFDTQSGFRAISNKFLRNNIEKIKPGRYETEMKMLISALRGGYNVGSVKVSTVYFDNNKNSKFNPIRDSFSVLKQFFLFAGFALSAWILDYFLFILLNAFFSVFFVWAHMVSKIISVIYYFYVNKYIVFKSYNHSLFEILRYLFIVSLNIIITSGLLYLLVSNFELNQFISKPLVDVLMFVINFFVLKGFVYNK